MSKIMRAAGTIRVCRFVSVNTAANNTIIEGETNAFVIGISQEGGRTAPIPDVSTDPVEAAQSGEDLRVYLPGETMECLLYAGSGGWTAGDLLKSDTDGGGVAVASSGTTQQNYGALALETVSAGELGKVMPLVGKFYPALA